MGARHTGSVEVTGSNPVCSIFYCKPQIQDSYRKIKGLRLLFIHVTNGWKEACMNPLPNLHDIQMIVSQLGEQYGADRIYLFGSYARGEANETSDIDLRIDRGSIRGWALGGLLADLEESLQKKVDLLTTGSLQKDFLDSIKNEEVLLYERNPG